MVQDFLKRNSPISVTLLDFGQFQQKNFKIVNNGPIHMRSKYDHYDEGGGIPKNL